MAIVGGGEDAVRAPAGAGAVTWSQARAALYDDLVDALLTTLPTNTARSAAEDRVYRAPPPATDANGPVVMMVPPARDVERRASGIRRTVYHQRIVVMSQVTPEGEAQIDDVASGVDDVVEAINLELDGELTLDGAAVAVSPPSWDEMTVNEYPAGSGLTYAQMVCTLDVEVERVGAFRS